MILKDPSNIQFFPHLGINYNADLLIVKNGVDKLMPLSL